MPKRSARDYRLLRSMMSAMDLTQQLVGSRKRRRGRPSSWPTHPWWTAGVVDVPKVEAFVDKLHQKHHVLASPREKSLARHAGASTSYLVMRPRRDRRWRDGELLAEGWVWEYVLMSSAQREPQMQNGHRPSSPVRWQGRFELVLDESGWTWRLTSEEFERLRWNLLGVIQRSQAVTPQLAAARIKAGFGDVTVLPRYRGVREQVVRLVREARWAVRRDHPNLKIWLPDPHELRRKSKRRRVPIYESREGHPCTLGAWLTAWEHEQLS